MQVVIDGTVIASEFLTRCDLRYGSNKLIDNLILDFKGKEKDEEFFKGIGQKFTPEYHVKNIKIGNNDFQGDFVLCVPPNGTCHFFTDESELRLTFRQTG